MIATYQYTSVGVFIQSQWGSIHCKTCRFLPTLREKAATLCHGSVKILNWCFKLTFRVDDLIYRPVWVFAWTKKVRLKPKSEYSILPLVCVIRWHQILTELLFYQIKGVKCNSASPSGQNPYLLKPLCRHFVNIVDTVCTRNCHFDNVRWYQWQH